MQKLELKHLAPYLPYGIKAIVSSFEGTNQLEGYIDEITSLSNDFITFVESSDFYFYDEYPEIEVKPLLRPLSDLTKEIEHNGERFVPSEIMCGGTLPISAKLQQIEDYQKRPLLMPFGCVEYLLKWHFDVFGLIDKGLAVDINTLKT